MSEPSANTHNSSANLGSRSLLNADGHAGPGAKDSLLALLRRLAPAPAARRNAWILNYGYAGVVTLAAIAVSLGVRTFFTPGAPAPSVALFVGIALIARRCSLQATVLAVVISTFVIDLFLTPPLLELDDPLEDVVVGVAMLLVALVVKRVDDDLRSAREVWRRLQDSSSQALDAEERVRREIAELLHSRVQSRLVATWSHLHTLDELVDTDAPRAKALLSSIMKDLDDIREREIRQASYLLHPSFIREGLGPAVDALVEHYERDFAITVELSPAFAALDTPVRNRLPESLRLAAFRVVEEALGNVLRHAHATQVRIAIGLTRDGQLHVDVEDDGSGFDQDRMRPGLGMGCIESWVKRVDGAWNIRSQPGLGTLVSVTLPIPPSRKIRQLGG